MVLSVSAKNEKQRWDEVPVPESSSKISEFIGKCQECNEEHRKTYAAVLAML